MDGQNGENFLLIEQLLLVIDHRPTTDLNRSFQQFIKCEAS